MLALEKSAYIISQVLIRTALSIPTIPTNDHIELKIVESLDLYQTTDFSKMVKAVNQNYLGVIFDMDGTLTKPGAIDY